MLMRWLELLRIVPKDNHAALRFTEPHYWAIRPTKDAAAFFRCLPMLNASGAVLYLEDSTERRFADFLESQRVPDPSQVAVATIFPRPDFYHVPATASVLDHLASLVVETGSSFPAFHIALYRDATMLLSWLDAFHDDQIRVSSRFPEEEVRAFAEALDVTYEWRDAAVVL